MPSVRKAKDPVVLSYLALRKAVGIIAFALPFAVSIPVLVHFHCIQPSISGYYYTCTRNVLVGALCAVAMFLLACRGYDHIDRWAGTFAAVCALGVAFFPTSPEFCSTDLCHPNCVPSFNTAPFHFTFAALLFLTLAFFCLALFTRTGPEKQMTARKRQRNKVYIICGIVILVSVALIPLFHFFPNSWPLPIPYNFFFETTALLAFGIAWMVKGELVLGDPEPERTRSITTDRLPLHD